MWTAEEKTAKSAERSVSMWPGQTSWEKTVLTIALKVSGKRKCANGKLLLETVRYEPTAC